MDVEAVPGDDSQVRVDVLLREGVSSAVFERQRDVLERLYRCVDVGAVDDVTVRSWERRVRLPGDDPKRDVLPPSLGRRKFGEFEAWADENGYDLAPGFRRHETASLVSYEACEVVDLPIVCVARYVGDELTEVVPRGTDEGVRTVQSELAALENGSPTADQPLDALQ